MTIPGESLIDRCLDFHVKHQSRRGVDTDAVSFVGGFMCCFGILTGRVDIGLPPDTPLVDIYDRLQRDLEDYRTRVIGAQREENLRGG